MIDFSIFDFMIKIDDFLATVNEILRYYAPYIFIAVAFYDTPKIISLIRLVINDKHQLRKNTESFNRKYGTNYKKVYLVGNDQKLKVKRY